MKEFIEALFNQDEYTCFSDSPKGIRLWPAIAAAGNVYDIFFAINPMDQSKTRADSSVIQYRNILIEMDKIPLDKQEEHIKEIRMPYTTAVFSGSKSIHYIISLESELQDEQEYRALVKRVYKAVGDDIVDQSNKNPSRFSRFPGSFRPTTGKLQQLLFVGPRVPNLSLESWLESRGAPKEELWENLTPEPRSTFKNPGRLYSATKNFLMFGATENWNMRLFKASADLCRCGYTEDESIEVLKKITGHLDFSDMKTINSAFKNEMEKKR